MCRLRAIVSAAVVIHLLPSSTARALSALRGAHEKELQSVDEFVARHVYDLGKESKYGKFMATGTSDDNDDDGGYQYLGCFQYDSENSKWYLPYHSNEMTVEVCYGHCARAEALYMAMLLGQLCLCGWENDVKEYTGGGEAVCDVSCYGDSSQTCGGSWTFDMYRLGDSTVTPLSATSPTPTPVLRGTAGPTYITAAPVTPSPTASETREAADITPVPATPSPTPREETMEAVDIPGAGTTPSPTTDEEPSEEAYITPAPATPSPTVIESSFETVDILGSSATNSPTPPPPAAQITNAQSSTMGSVPSPDMQKLLDLHNAIRCMHDADPLSYNTDVEATAQAYAKFLTAPSRCGGKLVHNADTHYGENLAECWTMASAGDCFSPEVSMETLYDGEVGENLPVAEYGGHARQILWKSTTMLGCAVEACTVEKEGVERRYNVLVCNYDPRGNVLGEYEIEVGLKSKTEIECGYTYGMAIAIANILTSQTSMLSNCSG